MDVSENFNFIDGDTIIATLPLELIKKASKLVEAIDLDDGREIEIPNLNPYSNADVVSHLKRILEVISTNTSLKEPITNYIANPLYTGISKVAGNLNNLIIYLYLTNWLDIPILFKEIVETLRTFTPEIDEIPKYLDITERILRNKDDMTKFQKRALFKLLENTTALTFPNATEILQKIINNHNLDLYDRYVISMNYSLYGIKAPLDEVDVITARRLYSQYEIISPIIANEIPKVLKTKQYIVDSISQYGLATRVAQPENGEERGYFYFYIQNKHKDKVYVGDVIANNKTYKVYIKHHSLFSIPELKDVNLVYTQNYFDHSDPNLYQNNYHNIQWYNPEYHPAGYIKFIFFQHMDTAYRQWLNEQDLLTNFEKSMLPLRIETRNIFLRIYRLRQEMFEPTGFNAGTTEKKVEETTLLTALRDKIIQIYTSEEKFYQSDTGKKLEVTRQSLRNKFFESDSLYGGSIAATEFYQPIEITDSEITLKATIDGPFDILFQSIKLESSRIIGLCKLKNGAVRCENYGRGLSRGYQLSNYSVNGQLYASLTKILSNHFDPIHSLFVGDGQSMNPDVVVIVDPSILNNIDEIKSQSDPQNTNMLKIVAYPHDNPKMYITPNNSVPENIRHMHYKKKAGENVKILSVHELYPLK